MKESIHLFRNYKVISNIFRFINKHHLNLFTDLILKTILFKRYTWLI